jgi:hypothetical protein
MGCLDQLVKKSYGRVMDRTPHHRLRWSEAWTVEPGPDPTVLVLSAGADRRAAVDGLAPGTCSAVARWAATGHLPTSPARSGGAAGGVDPRLVDRLVELGAVRPVVPQGRPVVVAGDPAVGERLGALLAEAAGDLVVAVRTGADWPELPDPADGAGGRLHLGVDLALHHTVVLGPLVLPGVTACLACLDARVAHRWGRAAVPDRPAVQRRLAVVAELVGVQVELAAAGTSPLLNATAAWNLETGEVDRQSLYKLAGCPGCGPAAAPTGRVALPWVAA